MTKIYISWRTVVTTWFQVSTCDKKLRMKSDFVFIVIYFLKHAFAVAEETESHLGDKTLKLEPKDQYKLFSSD